MDSHVAVDLVQCSGITHRITESQDGRCTYYD